MDITERNISLYKLPSTYSKIALNTKNKISREPRSNSLRVARGNFKGNEEAKPGSERNETCKASYFKVTTKKQLEKEWMIRWEVTDKYKINSRPPKIRRRTCHFRSTKKMVKL